jgi:hypothetical protein
MGIKYLSKNKTLYTFAIGDQVFIFHADSFDVAIRIATEKARAVAA